MTEATTRSLLDAFEPPDGLVGHTAVIVTMTADPDVLEAALERFTGLGARARARLGRRTAYLMRDAGSWSGREDVLSPNSVPGMHELRPKSAWPRLLHAKMALLSFSRSGRGAPTHARLVVGTGNYTRASVQRLLELVFVTETRLDDDQDPSALADLSAAAGFVRKLADRHFQATAERSSDDHRSPLFELDELTRELARLRSSATPRFFDSLDAPLFEGLEHRVDQQVKGGRNLLLCGSGFFESGVCEEEGPEVLERIASLSCIAQRARKVLVVHPETSGQLKTWASRAGATGWDEPVRATDPRERLSRALHAKYILFGRTIGASDEVRGGAHLYLGSGNLSRRGMTARSRQGGNIECGVFFRVEQALDEDALLSGLFWSADAAPIEDDEWKTLPPLDGATTPPPIVCCPILHARVEDDGTVALAWAEDSDAPVILWLDGTRSCQVDRAGGEVPMKVTVIPDTFRVTSVVGDREWLIPVLDDHGRYAWSREPFQTIEDVLAAVGQLTLTDDEQSFDEDEPSPRNGRDAAAATAAMPVDRRYPLLEMARFLEQLARAQQQLEVGEADLWIEHLGRIRDRTDDRLLECWRSTSIDLIEHLSTPAFAPPSMKKDEQRRYRKALDTLAKRWRLQ